MNDFAARRRALISAQNDKPITGGLLLCHFDGSGADAFGHTTTYTGTYTGGKFGQGITNCSESIFTSSDICNQINSDFTLDFWFKPVAVHTAFIYPFCFGKNDNPNNAGNYHSHIEWRNNSAEFTLTTNYYPTSGSVTSELIDTPSR